MKDDHATQIRLAEAIETFNNHNLMRLYNSHWHIIRTNFSRGLAFGLDSVIGASLLIYVTIQVLALIEFIPILGNWALKLISEIENSR